MTDGATDQPGRAKRAWPLFLLAGASFIPAFGVFFGAAAVTWALVSDRPRALVAAGLGATGALLNILASGLLVWRLGSNPVYAASRAIRARRDITKLVVALETYRREQGQYPARLDAFTQLPYSLRLVNIQDFSAGVFSRPRVYHYDLAPDGRSYTLFAVGADGRPGTADDVFPDVPGSLTGRSGYRAR